ncbi:hypothetical protein HPP92_012474 [Vanilla planifolia]|uniref:Uncharacterized protein n=1 Tax=Vanilla planifolia TaxID=51239 RepID=A0A835QQJ2_VANPL|nr:hypothetical protein HPP92_012474 [Vanilla planifolia]
MAPRGLLLNSSKTADLGYSAESFEKDTELAEKGRSLLNLLSPKIKPKHTEEPRGHESQHGSAAALRKKMFGYERCAWRMDPTL